jgi:hypothetical protein
LIFGAISFQIKSGTSLTIVQFESIEVLMKVTFKYDQIRLGRAFVLKDLSLRCVRRGGFPALVE